MSGRNLSQWIRFVCLLPRCVCVLILLICVHMHSRTKIKTHFLHRSRNFKGEHNGTVVGEVSLISDDVVLSFHDSVQ